MKPPGLASEDEAQSVPGDLAAAARLFGRLLVRELDVATLADLRQSEIEAVLGSLGILVPSDDQLPELASRYFDLFLHPEGALPPILSLWRDGQYDADPANSIREIAAAANCELAEGARSAAPDHLGCILLLWAELCGDRPDLAKLLVSQHMAWADLALQHALKDQGFYGAVCRAALSLMRELRQDA